MVIDLEARVWQVLSTREWAVVFWGLVILGLTLSRPGGRSGLRDVVSTFFGKGKLVAAWVSMAGYFALIVYVAAQVGLWNPGLWKDTVWWLVLASWGTFMATLEALKQRSFFRDAVNNALAASAVSQFVLNLATLPLWMELILQPLIALLVMTRLVAERNKEQVTVVKVLDVLLIAVGLLVIAWTVHQLATHPQDYFTIGKLFEFAFSAWLPIAMLGWIYPMALLMAYEDLHTIYKVRVYRRPGAVQFLKIAIAYNFALHDVVDLKKDARLATEVATNTSVRAIRELRRQKAARVRRQTSAVDLQAQRLKRFADVQGSDAQGFMLDQREHAETKEALRYLFMCAAGHYRHDDRFKPDMLRFMDNFARQGLPEEHGIHFKVRADGKAWRAWRRTATGHVFGIGAVDGPKSEWFMDGKEPPRHYPRKGSDGWQQHLETGEWKVPSPRA